MKTTTRRMATKKKPTKRRRARLEKTELFRFVGYEPHEGQLEVHLSKAPRRVLACASRWGKSTCAAMEAVAALLAPCAQ